MSLSKSAVVSSWKRGLAASCLLGLVGLFQGCLAPAADDAGPLEGVWMMAQARYQSTYGTETYSDTLAPDTSDAYARRFIVVRGEALFSVQYASDGLDEEEAGSGVSLTRLRDLGGGRWLMGTSDTFTVVLSGDRVSFEYNRSGKFYDSYEDDSVSFTNHSFSQYVAYSRSFPPAEWYSPPPSEAEPNDTRETALSLSANGLSTAASLTLEDEDWFSFSAQAGSWYRISTGGSLDTYLELYGSSDVPLDEDDDGGSGSNGQIEWQCTQTGTYHIRVHGYGPDEQGRYTISVAKILEEALTKRNADRRPKFLRNPMGPFRGR